MFQEEKKKLWPLIQGAGVNKVFVRNVNDPMPTGQEETGAILICSEDGHYNDTLY